VPRVEIAVPASGNRTYTYRAQDHLQDRLTPGSRVLVPFGKGRRIGFVWGEGESDVPEDRLKDILAAPDEEPLIRHDIMDLCRWIADYYFAAPGDALALALPSAYLKPLDPTLAFTAKGLFAPGPGDALREELTARQRLPLSHLQQEASRWAAARALLSAGHAVMAGPGPSPRTAVPFYGLPPVPFERLLDACGKSPKQRAVLEIMNGEDRPFSLQELMEGAGVSAALVAGMAREGRLQKALQDRPYSMHVHRMSPAEGPILHPLTPDQGGAFTEVLSAISTGGFAPFLLYGVTDSGKTEVYLHAAVETIRRGGKVLYLVPEIGLTPAAASRLEALFPSRVAVFHSGLSEGERMQEFMRVRRGEADVVLGARSALFAPLTPLRLVIVDEEQDSAYKQEEGPRYHGRDAAVVRAQRAGAAVILGSATPSLESWTHGRNGKYRLLTLKERIHQSPLPSVHVVDVRREPPEPGGHGRVLFSAPLVEALQRTLDAGQQAVLLVQRRGWAPVLLCRLCGHAFPCPFCSVSHAVHHKRRALLCHYCGHQEPVPRKCPACGGEVLEDIGFATDKVAERFAGRFPGTPYAVLDRDAASRRGALTDILFRFSRKEIKVLIGTQMVAKGHHFPEVALVGILGADQLLHFPDFRSAERLFALAVQAAGRAGRGDVPGEVVIQTSLPDHYAVQCAAAQDFPAFYEKEKTFREAFQYPPMGFLALISVQAPAESKARDLAEAAAQSAREHPASNRLRILGPAPAPLSRLKSMHRYQVLLRCATRPPLHAVVRHVLEGNASRFLSVDMDPQNLL
jgi:primosomal protein N' (replication factor Y) (superfamily II helicase)